MDEGSWNASARQMSTSSLIAGPVKGQLTGEEHELQGLECAAPAPDFSLPTQ